MTEDKQVIDDAIHAIEHTIDLFKKMAERGDYPLELLPELDGKPNPHFTGKQGFSYLVENTLIA